MDNLFRSDSAILILEDGTIFRGTSFGKLGTAAGEICFNTGMTGYQEVFTDPSYFGQIVVMNNVHIGNYGTLDDEVESESAQVKGIIGRNLELRYSRFASKESIQQYFERQNIVGIYGIDTRALVIHIREKGAMNCIISSENFNVDELLKQLREVPSMQGLELASQVTTAEPYTLGDESSNIRVAVLDYGIKKNIFNCLAERGAFVKVFGTHTPFEEIEAFRPTGYFASNGPGDPQAMHYAIETTKKILAKKKPFFGICLGQQLLALANGIPTFKMHHGHRGLNHPVKNVVTGKCEITTQNHGFGVDEKTVKEHPNVTVTHINLNDGSIEGIRLNDRPAFSVQYHPESTPGPHDSRYLFDDFFEMMQEELAHP